MFYASTFMLYYKWSDRQYWTSKEDMVNGYVIIIMDFLEPFITGFMSF